MVTHGLSQAENVHDDLKLFMTIAVGKLGDMFAYRHYTNPARLIKFNARQPTKPYIELAKPPGPGREGPALCAIDEKFIMISGGFHPETREFFVSVDLYVIDENSFKPDGFVPNLA